MNSVSPANSRRTIQTLAILLASCGLWGCEEGYKPPVLDAPKARATVTAVLDHWKSGKKPELLQRMDPPVVFNDADWAKGVKLVKYELDGEGVEKEGCLFTKVKLTLQPGSGGPKESTVTYIVGTSPALTMQREPTPQ